MRFSLKNKVVIVTGASSGIGEALVLLLAEKQAKVVLAARNLSKLNELKARIQQKNTDAIAVKTDVSKREDCEKLISKTKEKFGKIDVLINNAGLAMRAMFQDAEVKVIEELMKVNFWGSVYCTKSALPYLLKTNGSVVNINSIAGYVGLPARSGYTASKYAIRGFFDTLRIEHLKDGLQVLVVAPSFTKSNIRNTALNKKGEPQGESPRDEKKMMPTETCAKYIIRAIEKRKNEVFPSFWEGKFTVWFKKWFPRLLDKLIYNHMKKESGSPLK